MTPVTIYAVSPIMKTEPQKNKTAFPEQLLAKNRAKTEHFNQKNRRQQGKRQEGWELSVVRRG